MRQASPCVPCEREQPVRKHFTRAQKNTIIQGIFSIVLMVAVLQLWLITATMNSYLGGDAGVPLPAAIFSILCFALNLGLLRFLYGLDRATGGPSSADNSRNIPEPGEK